MLECQSGNRRAFEALITKYQAPVLNLIYRYTGDRAGAEDTAQEVFLKIYNARKSYKPSGKFSNYVYTIVNNICLNEIRDNKRRQEVSIHGQVDDETSPQVDKESDKERVSDHFRKLELQVAVKSAIDSLPPQQRMAIILDKYEDLCYEDISKVMKTSVSAVKSLLSRARENLKERLKKYIGEQRI